ncbi:hypothetical protein DBA20_09155 [Pandoraea capi]|nr:hypothetical protein [Pandoraea sp. LA3]MDN4583153.1 hypothetical protein [Pandoraea capi]
MAGKKTGTVYDGPRFDGRAGIATDRELSVMLCATALHSRCGSAVNMAHQGPIRIDSDRY